MSKIKNGGLDQYGAVPFKHQQFGTAGVERVNLDMKLGHSSDSAHVPNKPCIACCLDSLVYISVADSVGLAAANITWWATNGAILCDTTHNNMTAVQGHWFRY